MESYNKDLKVDLYAVIASKSERIAKCTPKFILSWLKSIVHQDELNDILRFSEGAIDVEFADKTLQWLNAKSNVKFTNRESLHLDKRYIFVSNHPLGGHHARQAVRDHHRDSRNVQGRLRDGH